METKIKKDWLGRVKSIEELHDDSKLWMSEVSFINDELHFFNDLLSTYYIDIVDSGLSEEIKKIIKKITQEKESYNAFMKLIQYHEKLLSKLIYTGSVTSNPNYLKMHQDLEFKVDAYIKNSKLLKKQIFSIVEAQMRKKEQKKLL